VVFVEQGDTKLIKTDSKNIYKVSISPKCRSFDFSIHQQIFKFTLTTKILSSTMTAGLKSI